MRTRTLKAGSAGGLALFDLSEPRPKQRPWKRFRRFIENTDWDEKLLQRLEWVDACACALAAAASLSIAALSLLILR